MKTDSQVVGSGRKPGPNNIRARVKGKAESLRKGDTREGQRAKDSGRKYARPVVMI